VVPAGVIMNNAFLKIEAKNLGFILKFGDYWECPKCSVTVNIMAIKTHQCSAQKGKLK